MSASERVEGSKLIEAEVKRAYSAAHKVVDSIRWEPDVIEGVSAAISYHLHIQSGGKILTLREIPRETIDDYPSKVDNEILNAYIRELASK